MKWKKMLFISFFICGTNLFAMGNPLQEMRNMMKNVLVDNQKFMEDPRYNDAFFQGEASGQHPRMTIVACADSRVHTSNFDFHPLGDVFFIRNIGNQIETSLGSIDYGILHLHTPLLLFLGHSKCGAITAVTKGTEELEVSIRDELSPILIGHRAPHPTDRQIAENVAENVQHQVSKAVDRYRKLVNEGKLWVVGAVYDFTPEAHGKFKVIQVNNRTDQELIDAFLADVEAFGDYEDDPGRVPSERS